MYADVSDVGDVEGGTDDCNEHGTVKYSDNVGVDVDVSDVGDNVGANDDGDDVDGVDVGDDVSIP